MKAHTTSVHAGIHVPLCTCYKCAFMHTCTSMYMLQVCMHACIYVPLCTCYKCAFMHTCTSMYAHTTSVHAYMHLLLRMYMLQVCTHAYMDVPLCTHVHNSSVHTCVDALQQLLTLSGLICSISLSRLGIQLGARWQFWKKTHLPRSMASFIILSAIGPYQKTHREISNTVEPLYNKPLNSRNLCSKDTILCPSVVV